MNGSMGWPRGSSVRQEVDLDTGGKRPWWYYPDKPSRFDDDFMGPNLDPKWTIARNAHVSGGTCDIYTDGMFRVRGGTVGILQPMPSGAFNVSCRVIGTGGPYSSGSAAGVILSTAADGTGYQYSNLGSGANHVNYWTNNNRWTSWGYAGDSTYIGNTNYPEFFRTYYDGAGNQTNYYSYNGLGWISYSTSHTGTSPAYIGVVAQAYTATDWAIVDSFRVEQL